MPTELQRAFAEKAQDETSHLGLGGKYRLPWTRGLLRSASKLDPIYDALANPNQWLIENLIIALPTDKKRKYKKTLNWIVNEFKAEQLRNQIRNQIVSYHFGISLECSIGGADNRFKNHEDACGYFVFSEGLYRIRNVFRT